MDEAKETQPPPGPHPDAIAFVRICEDHRTRRFYALMATIVLLAGILAWAIVRIVDKPWWSALLVALVTIVTGQSGLFWFLNRRFGRYTRLNQSRVANFEKRLDPRRSSSQMQTDGSNPPEDYL